MLEEVSAAAEYFVTYVTSGDKKAYREALIANLLEHNRGHWHPSNPVRGQGFRSIRVDQAHSYVDPVLLKAATAAGFTPETFQTALSIPGGFAQMFIDPFEVEVETKRGLIKLYSSGSPSRSPPMKRTSPPPEVRPKQQQQHFAAPPPPGLSARVWTNLMGNQYFDPKQSYSANGHRAVVVY